MHPTSLPGAWTSVGGQIVGLHATRIGDGGRRGRWGQRRIEPRWPEPKALRVGGPRLRCGTRWTGVRSASARTLQGAAGIRVHLLDPPEAGLHDGWHAFADEEGVDFGGAAVGVFFAGCDQVFHVFGLEEHHTERVGALGFART